MTVDFRIGTGFNHFEITNWAGENPKRGDEISVYINNETGEVCPSSDWTKGHRQLFVVDRVVYSPWLDECKKQPYDGLILTVYLVESNESIENID